MQWYVVKVPESESPVFTIDRTMYPSRLVCTTIEAVLLCTLLLQYSSEGSSFGLETRRGYIVASDIASVASRIIMQTLRRLFHTSVGRSLAHRAKKPKTD